MHSYILYIYIYIDIYIYYYYYYLACDIACLGCEGQKQRDCYVCHPAAYKILDADSLAGYMCIMNMPNAYFESVDRLIHRNIYIYIPYIYGIYI